MAIDQTLAFIRDPYRTISRYCYAKNTEAIETRIFFKKTWFLVGKDAAELFYDPAKIEQTNPLSKEHLLKVFQDNFPKLKRIFSVWLATKAESWQRESEIILNEEFNEILTATACEWTGVRLTNGDLKIRARELSSLTDQAGIGLKQFISKASGNSVELWIQGLIEDIRSSGHEFKGQNIIDQMAWLKNADAKLLDPHLAALEMIALLRSIVALSSPMLFIVHALEENPECREPILLKEKNYSHRFIQEILRYYPITPPLLGYAREDFHWRGHHFKKDQRVLLDLYGTNHDSAKWEHPYVFNPNRFEESQDNFYDKDINQLLLGVALDFFVTAIDYKVPEQNLSIDWNHLPAIPKDGMIIDHIYLRKKSRFTDRNSSLGNAIFS